MKKLWMEPKIDSLDLRMTANDLMPSEVNDGLSWTQVSRPLIKTAAAAPEDSAKAEISNLLILIPGD